MILMGVCFELGSITLTIEKPHLLALTRKTESTNSMQNKPAIDNARV
jgi:hypothetical protein